MIESEVKFQINNILEVLRPLNKYTVFRNNLYIKDVTYYSTQDKRRILFRSISDFKCKTSYHVLFKRRIKPNSKIKTEIEDVLYEGNDLKEANKSILAAGNFTKINSYEKNRITFDCKILPARVLIDFYPFGSWMKIESEPETMWHVVRLFGLKKSDAIAKNANELYYEWAQKHSLKKEEDIQFGLIKN